MNAASESIRDAISIFDSFVPRVPLNNLSIGSPSPPPPPPRQFRPALFSTRSFLTAGRTMPIPRSDVDGSSETRSNSGAVPSSRLEPIGSSSHVCRSCFSSQRGSPSIGNLSDRRWKTSPTAVPAELGSTGAFRDHLVERRTRSEAHSRRLALPDRLSDRCNAREKGRRSELVHARRWLKKTGLPPFRTKGE